MQRDLRSSHKRSWQMTQDCDCDAPWGSTKPGGQQSSGVCGLECAWDLSWPRRVTVCLGHGGGCGIKRLGVSLRLGVISKFVLTFLIAMTQSFLFCYKLTSYKDNFGKEVLCFGSQSVMVRKAW